MADIWHTTLEVPELNRNVLANNETPRTVNITGIPAQTEFMSNPYLIRWRYTYEPDVWHTTEDTPTVGSSVVAEYVEYKVWEITDGNVQTNFINDSNIIRWCYWEDALSIKATQNGKYMSCIKEGSDNDWADTTNGVIIMESDIKALRQQINARIQTLPNEVDGFDGIDYLNIIFGNTTWGVKAQALINVMQDIPAVKSVAYVAASWDNKREGDFRMTFAVDSVFGDLSFVFGLNEQNKTINLN